MLGDFIQNIYISKISIFSSVIRRGENNWFASHMSVVGWNVFKSFI